MEHGGRLALTSTDDGIKKRPGRPPSRLGERGFTLLETVLVLVIITGVLGILVAAVRIGLSSWEKGEAKAGSLGAKKVLTQKFFEDVSSMYPFMSREDMKTKYNFMGGPRRVVFVTAAHSGGFAIPWGGTSLMDYRVEKEGFVISEKTLPLADVPNTSERSIEFGPEIKDVTFEYLGGDGWSEGWDADRHDSLPKAIRARVVQKDGSDFKVTVPVRTSKYWADADSGAQPSAPQVTQGAK